MRSIENFRDVLDEITAEYNVTVQNGEMLRDSCGRYLSPQQAIESGICGQPGIKARPIKKLSAHSRALLATHKRRCYVSDDGLVIKINNTDWPYWGKDLADYKHKYIWAYLNFEQPEVLVCSDEDRQNYFTLTAKVLPALSASRKQMEEAMHERGAFMHSSKVVQSRLPHPFTSTIVDDNDGDARVREFGQVVTDAAASHESQADAEDKLMSKIRRNCRMLGRPAPSRPRDLASYLAGQEMEIETLGLRENEVDRA
jgi:hypothetical protein